MPLAAVEHTVPSAALNQLAGRLKFSSVPDLVPDPFSLAHQLARYRPSPAHGLDFGIMPKPALTPYPAAGSGPRSAEPQSHLGPSQAENKGKSEVRPLL
ncbi:hypothetical protein BCR44DRAFT_1118765 [Catenaria anguillulae PL171]|uniref:Uncharacterized protein n=1 Tax=Catenaria anguillulae PL171 TaxID=765915 RepID=A0A1Y2HLA0_9FUNG|nr:hypothetical protein BCR44DRAFT_1118765 [Catenaria anguillulae PL171]